MDDKFLELKMMETILEANYTLVRNILETFMAILTGKPTADFLELSEKEQMKILDGNITAGKVYEMLSRYLTSTLNKKIETDSALKAYTTEKKDSKDGSK